MIIDHPRGNLTRRFGALTAVDHLNLEVAQGEIFGAGGSGRRRQDHHHAAAVRPDGSDRRQGDRSRATTSPRSSTRSRIRSATWRSASACMAISRSNENMAFYADLFGIIGREREELSGGCCR